MASESRSRVSCDMSDPRCAIGQDKQLLINANLNKERRKKKKKKK